MTEQEIINTVKEITAQKRHKQSNDVNLNSNFTQDLGADSLDMLEIIWQISEKCDIQPKLLEDQLARQNITSITVDDMVTAVCKTLGIERSTNKGSTTIVGLLIAITNRKSTNIATINNKNKTK